MLANVARLHLMEWFSVCGRLLLALIFVLAATTKLADRPGTRRALFEFRVPRPLIGPMAFALPLAELATAAALIFHQTVVGGAIGAIVLLAAFTAGIAAAMARGEAPDCHCFGQVHSAPAGPATLIRNGCLLGLALALVFLDHPGLDTWAEARTGEEIALLVMGIAIVSLSIALLGLWARLNAIEERASRPAPIVARGANVPDLTLRSTAGGRVQLGQLDGDDGFVLTFVSPGCGPCHQLLPDLSRWQRTLAERLPVYVVASGESDEVDAMVRDHGLTDALLDDGSGALQRLEVPGTPSAVYVDGDRKFASAWASGSSAIEALVRASLKKVPVPT
jgi:hypothetical protein